MHYGSGKGVDWLSKTSSKWSLPSKVSVKSSASFNKNLSETRSPEIESKNTKQGSPNWDLNNNSFVKNLKSVDTFESQSSTGTSTLNTIQGLNEVKKVIMSKHFKSTDTEPSIKCNKVYSHKLNQLISIIKYNVNRKPTKKKSTVTKLPNNTQSK